ncbi:MAG: M23 family metallopeptidase [Pseudonocardia sp.]|nr:M23 family metallopeptidase [Pseudonocardia sp.]
MPRRGYHRASAPTPIWHSRATLAAVATGAAVAAGHTVYPWERPVDSTRVTQLAIGALIQSTSVPANPRKPIRKNDAARPAPELATRDDDADVADIQSLTKAVRLGEQLAHNTQKIQAALADGAPAASLFGDEEFVRPCEGVFTSGFSARWGTFHYGIDLANKIGTPIYAVTDGTVIESGPASGFGMWIRILHPGGWTSVYGHINRSFVHAGQRVRAGQQIAEMGNRGESTGPHLHLEIWNPSGIKINPLPWLAARGIRIAGSDADPS